VRVDGHDEEIGRGVNPLRANALFQSQAQTNATLAAQAANNVTVSASRTRSQKIWQIGLMAGNIRRF
jgi:hypothetical protein